MSFKLTLTLLTILGLCVEIARADVTVTNKATSTIQVKIDSGSKTEIKRNDKVVFNTNKSEVTVTIYASGSEKASSKVKNNSKLKVTNASGIWTIADD